jgi:hypothetical protein
LRAAAPTLDVVYCTREDKWTLNLDTAISTSIVDVNHAAAVSGYEIAVYRAVSAAAG